MNITKTAWATAMAAALAVTSLSAHADKKESVQRILALQQSGLDELAKSVAEQPARQLAGNVRQILAQAVPEDKREATAKQIDAEIKKYVESATPVLRSTAAKLAQTTIGPMIEEKFTEDELKQLVTMLESPTLKKYQGLMPEFTQSLLEKVMAEARPQVTPKLQQLDTNVRKILENATGSKLGGQPAASSPSTAPAKPSKK